MGPLLLACACCVPQAFLYLRDAIREQSLVVVEGELGGLGAELEPRPGGEEAGAEQRRVGGGEQQRVGAQAIVHCK